MFLAGWLVDWLVLWYVNSWVLLSHSQLNKFDLQLYTIQIYIAAIIMNRWASEKYLFDP